MVECQTYATSVMPIAWLGLAPLGLSENDCLQIVDSVREITAAWKIDLHEDAFDQPSLIMSPHGIGLLQLTLIAYRINERCFLEEIRAGNRHEDGEFATMNGLLEAIRCRIAVWSMTPSDRHGTPNEALRIAPLVATAD